MPRVDDTQEESEKLLPPLHSEMNEAAKALRIEEREGPRRLEQKRQMAITAEKNYNRAAAMYADRIRELKSQLQASTPELIRQFSQRMRQRVENLRRLPAQTTVKTDIHGDAVEIADIQEDREQLIDIIRKADAEGGALAFAADISEDEIAKLLRAIESQIPDRPQAVRMTRDSPSRARMITHLSD